MIFTNCTIETTQVTNCLWIEGLVNSESMWKMKEETAKSVPHNTPWPWKLYVRSLYLWFYTVKYMRKSTWIWNWERSQIMFPPKSQAIWFHKQRKKSKWKYRSNPIPTRSRRQIQSISNLILVSQLIGQY